MIKKWVRRKKINESEDTSTKWHKILLKKKKNSCNNCFTVQAILNKFNDICIVHFLSYFKHFFAIFYGIKIPARIISHHNIMHVQCEYLIIIVQSRLRFWANFGLTMGFFFHLRTTFLQDVLLRFYKCTAFFERIFDSFKSWMWSAVRLGDAFLDFRCSFL